MKTFLTKHRRLNLVAVAILGTALACYLVAQNISAYRQLAVALDGLNHVQSFSITVSNKKLNPTEPITASKL